MQTKWIDLGEPTVKLKLGQISGGLYLFIIGLSNAAPQWPRAVSELGFVPAQNNRYLVRRIRDGESPRASTFRTIWPQASIALMEKGDFFLDFAKGRKDAQRTEEERRTEIDLTLYQRLGRNSNGDEVLTGSLGRIVRLPDDTVVRESDQTMRAPMFLRAESAEDMGLCADGFVRSMDRGEVQYREDLERFVKAVYADEQASEDAVRVDGVRAQIHAAMLRQVRAAHDTAQDAFGDSARLYDYLPPYWGEAPGAGAMPLPLAVISQRLLGDTAGKTVLVPNAFDGAAFSFLPGETRVHAFHGGKDLSALAPQLENVTWHASASDIERTQSDAIFFNADPTVGPGGKRKDYVDAARLLRTLVPGGRAVLTIAGDDPSAPGVVSAESEQFLSMLSGRFEIEDAFELGSEMAVKVGTGAALRVISLRNVAPATSLPLSGGTGFPGLLPVVHGWDEVKSRVDETLARAAVREASSDDVNLKAIAEDNNVQRPYLPFSKVGEARTMVPSNLQGPLNSALADVEARHGAIDEFVSSELGFLDHTLGERLSPEQVDAVGLSISRMKMGRANILGDETGIGKGRTLGSLAVWANKQGKNVVFITDRANLFSDFFAGDLGDLGERGRFRPMILNTGEPVVDKNSPLDPPPILISASKADDVARIIEQNQSLDDLGVNLVFATYSQLNGAESEKATWLKNQLPHALLIVDEAHVAAGANSNISSQIQSMCQLAWAVQYSTATWAKSSKNLGIYCRAFPETINTASLAQTMKRGGEAFSELFSSMLARDGALTRREHDLSRMERVIEIDDVGRSKSIELSDAVAGVMNQIALVSGDIDRMMVRLNSDVLKDLRAASEVRTSMLRVDVFSSSFGAGSMLYQVNRRVLAAINAEHVVRLCEKSMADGLRPIVIFDDTGEALTNSLLDEAARLAPDGVRPDVLREPTVKDLLRQILRRLDRVRVTPKNASVLLAAEIERERRAQAALAAERAETNGQEDVEEAQATDPDAEEVDVEQADRADLEGAIAAMEEDVPAKRGKAAVRYVGVEELPGLTEEQVASYRRGIAHIEREIDALPNVALNAPDTVHNLLRAQGYRTGEISGRSFQLVKTGDGDMCRVVPRSKKKSFVTATVRAYQNGEIDVVVINRAAATGIGLHAQPRFADPRKRAAIWLQSPENPTEVSQLAGRANRYDQLTAPRMLFAATGLYGEVRQIMQNNKKQVMLACNVRSSRDAAVKHDAVPDLLNDVGRDAVRQVLIDNPGFVQRMGIPVELLDDPSSDPTRWLNRVPMLIHSDQEKIYSEIYQAFDDAILRHELAGTNPLKSEELDIGAKIENKTAFIGVETEGLGSAFDGPVYIEEIKWTQRLSPMSWADVESRILAGRRALGESGRVAISGEHEGGMPLVDMGDLREIVAKQLDALVRIALASTPYDSVDSALLRVGKNHPVKRGVDRLLWVRTNLERLIPGTLLSVHDEVDALTQRQAVITSVEIPPPGKEHQFGKWKVNTIAPREGRTVSYTLAAIINSSSLGEQPGVAQSVLGTDLYEAGPGDRMRAVIQRYFDQAPSGLVDRSANVLTGNMYLASEWASATKLGRGVIFTDDRKVRHRGILLKPEFTNQLVQHLPVRLWTTEMIHEYVERALYGDHEVEFGGHLRVDRTFGSAWAHAQADAVGRGAVVAFDRGAGINLTGFSGGGMGRLAAALRTAQDRIRFVAAGNVKTKSSEDPLHVTISARVRKGVLTIKAETPEKMSRALDVLISGSGLELYATRHSQEGLLAQEVVNDYFEVRRARAEEELRNARAGRLLGRDATNRDAGGGDAPRERMAA